MAYKADVHYTRESPSIEIYRQLRARGAEVSFGDPMVESILADDEIARGREYSATTIEETNCVVMLTRHALFLTSSLWKTARLIVDTRNVISPGENVRHI